MAIRRDEKAAIEALEAVIKDYNVLKSKTSYDDFSDILPQDIHNFVTRGRAAIDRIAGRSSAYWETAMRAEGFPSEAIPRVGGSVEALHADIVAGQLRTYRELIHAEVFSDILEAAEHLRGSGYKDPAAVLAGGVLEQHLRELASSCGVAIQDASGKPKKADLLNAEIAKTGRYNILVQKQITAWLDLRNRAAHAKYSEYDAAQVSAMIDGVRKFIIDYPA